MSQFKTISEKVEFVFVAEGEEPIVYASYNEAFWARYRHIQEQTRRAYAASDDPPKEKSATCQVFVRRTLVEELPLS